MSSRKVFGSRAKRLEDPALLRGNGRFVDDILLPGLNHAAFLRSPHGHALIKGVVKDHAMAVPGVHGVFTLDDFKPHLVNDRLVVGFALETGDGVRRARRKLVRKSADHIVLHRPDLRWVRRSRMCWPPSRDQRMPLRLSRAWTMVFAAASTGPCSR